MKARIAGFAWLLLAMLFSGCAGTATPARGKLASVRTVAIDYTPSSVGQREKSSGSRVAGRVVRRGASFALGQVGLGLVGGLLGIVVDLPSSSDSTISPAALQAMRETKTDPVWLVAERFEKQLKARNRFAVTRANPDAVCDFNLRQAKFEKSDQLGLRPVLGVRARLRDRRGKVLWSKEATARGTVARTWQEYGERPARLRGDFEVLAGRVARQLADALDREAGR